MAYFRLYFRVLLEESVGNKDRIREVYERAIANVPPAQVAEIYLFVIFKKYIEIELQLCNFDSCRKLYEKYLEWSLENCYAWSKYAELERSLSETDRARAIFELAIAQPALDMPEEDRTKNLKVWISYAKTEALDSKEDDGGSDIPEDDVNEQKKQIIQRARRIFEKAINY
ncbi:hypothetical protein Ddye_002975 [Dipteronia dyeriana]|uniref:Pre-mRNA-splicing factor Syf1/CRNKL1-like C-terminal HAT-repeats domain-containing protein n=1 Tax=Dipteronia dyeriana TaxID=168575 RepID=A0AAD9XS17_9ROSI|nr:hypothetical protein Ddye_002975 [Dipteronia dyeriana]